MATEKIVSSPSNRRPRRDDYLQVHRTSSERIQQEKIDKSITANRLRFDRLGLCGRSEEVSTLKGCLSRLMEGKREFVLIGGLSGTGKTSLALELKRPLRAAHNKTYRRHVFCSGKHDLSIRAQPLVGIISASKELCERIMDLEEDDSRIFQSIQDELWNQLGENTIRLLSSVVPEIQNVVAKEDWNGSEQGIHLIVNINREDKKGQLEASFTRFINIISAHLPVVIAIDDLQWAGTSSLEVLKSLITSTGSNSGLLIVGCYRSNEVVDGHILQKMIRDMKEAQSRGISFTMTQLAVGNLSERNLTEMLSELLSKDESQVQELAILCHARTQGNIFFVKSFLSMLVEEGFLKFNIGAFTWDWNITAIEQETSAAPNLVELIHSRIQKVNRDSVKLLVLASCLGNRFDLETLRLIWEHTHSPEDNNNNSSSSSEGFDLLLKTAIDLSCLEAEGGVDETPGTWALKAEFQLYVIKPGSSRRRRASSIVQNNSTTLRFAHDQIQEAAMSLIDENEYLQLRHKVGLVLHKNLSSEKLESMLFVVVNLLNCGSSQRNPAFAAMNLRAGLKAKDVAAFTSALNFVQQGISHVSSSGSMWETHLDLAVELHSLGAIAEQSLPRYDEADKYCSIVLEQGNASSLQKAAVYKVKVDMLHTTGHGSEALDLCLDYLAALGCQFSRSKLIRKSQATSYMNKTRSHYIPSVDDIQKMPMMTDPVNLVIMQLLERAGRLAFLAKDSDLYILVRCRFIRWIVKHGLTEDAASAFASFGNVLMHRYGFIKTAIELAELSLATQKMLQSEYYEARTIFTANSYILAWTNPLRSRLKHFLEAYRLGLSCGNIFSAGTGLMFYLWAALVSGTNLRVLEEDCQVYCPQLERLQQLVSLEMVLPIWQLTQNLMGKSENTTILSGNVMEEEVKMASGAVHVVAVKRYKCLGCLYFGDYETGANMVVKLGGVDSLKTSFPGCGYGMEYLPFGVCCYAMARLSKHGKYKRTANTTRSEVKKLVKNGYVNLIHVLSALDAEYYAMSSKVEDAKRSYEKAIAEASRGGFLQNAAVANERYSDYLFEIGDSADAIYHFTQSIKNYDEWGAARKVDLMIQKLESMVSAQELNSIFTTSLSSLRSSIPK